MWYPRTSHACFTLLIKCPFWALSPAEFASTDFEFWKSMLNHRASSSPGIYNSWCLSFFGCIIPKYQPLWKQDTAEVQRGEQKTVIMYVAHFSVCSLLLTVSLDYKNQRFIQIHNLNRSRAQSACLEAQSLTVSRQLLLSQKILWYSSGLI